MAISEIGRRVIKEKRNPPSTEAPVTGGVDSAIFEGGNRDWRVRISLPTDFPAYDGAAAEGEGETQDVLAPLRETNNSMVFPYTPNIFLTHSANYNKLSPVHSNYPFPIYENSQVDQFIITGEFTAENEAEARYWIAAVHFMRSVTKMAYGRSENNGAPPPVLRLNGYGEFVFNNVPIIVEQFQLNMPNDVDYIRVADIGQGKGSWVPARSEISIGVSPAYSRDAVNRFSLDKFVKGEYISDPNRPGFM